MQKHYVACHSKIVYPDNGVLNKERFNKYHYDSSEGPPNVFNQRFIVDVNRTAANDLQMFVVWRPSWKNTLPA